MIDGAFVIGDPSVSAAGVIAASIESSTALRELAVIKKGKPEILTNYSSQLSDFQFGQQEVVTVKSRDGKFDIEAVLVKPVGYVKGKSIRSFSPIHGGPYGEFDNNSINIIRCNCWRKRV